ncbi:SymE family type I addiction module toxin [Pseudescherichia vulneris]
MAAKNFKPEVAIAKTVSNALPVISENRDAARKNDGISKPLRRMSVSYVSVRHYDRRTNITKRYTRSASLRLNGRWMEEAGFTTGTNLDIRVMPGCLVITVQEPLPAPPPEPEIMQTLKKVCKFSGRKQQFPEFIAMVSTIRPPVGKWI